MILRALIDRGYIVTNEEALPNSTGKGMCIANQLCRRLKVGFLVISEHGKFTRLFLISK